MFEGFTEQVIPTTESSVFARVGGSGPPILLLHGYPQTGACWQAVAPALAERFTVMVPDLRGYGRSGKPASDDVHMPYSKRAMATELVEAMSALGHTRFAVAGHDRGGRVAYRMALDHSEVVTHVAVLDIVPTFTTWEAMNWRAALGSYHWQFLAQPADLPERLIGSDPVYYLHNTLQRWAGPGFTFDAEALAEYESAFKDPAVIHACCEDYRAGASIDYELDHADFGAGHKIQAPLLSLRGARGGTTDASGFRETWQTWCSLPVEAHAVPGGHFLPEESPKETADHLLSFLDK